MTVNDDILSLLPATTQQIADALDRERSGVYRRLRALEGVGRVHRDTDRRPHMWYEEKR